MIEVGRRVVGRVLPRRQGSSSHSRQAGVTRRQFNSRRPGHSTSRITQQLERQFTSELMFVKDQKESFCTHQFTCELSLWSLSYRSSKIDTGGELWTLEPGGTLLPGAHPTTSQRILGVLRQVAQHMKARE